MSQFPVYLPGLEEVITHVFYRDPEGFMHKRTLRSDGSVARLGDLQVEEQAAFEARFGRVTAELARRVESASPDERILVGAVFDPGLGSDRGAVEQRFQDEEREFFEALRSGRVRVDDDGEVRANDPTDEPVARRHAERREEQTDHLRTQDARVLARSQGVRAALTQRGYAVEPMESSTPIVYLWVDAGAVATLARDPDVAWLFDATPIVGREHAAPNGMVMHNISPGMNAAPQNLNGTGQKVGLIENVKCAIHDNHDAFELAPATQYNSSGSFLQSCSTDANCSNFCKTAASSEPGVCRQLKSGVMRCVDPHLSWVASGIWGAKNESGFKDYGASRATPHVWTGSSAAATNTACVVSETQAAYDWFNTTGVKTVVGSYGCTNNSDDGFIEDWNVARRDVAIFKATPSGQTETEPGCRAANAICVGGMTSGGDSPIDGWQNPPTGSFFLDREPDLVAFAGDRPSPGVDVISLTGITAWEQKGGTSFANPLVANIATLLKQKCGGTIGPRYLRAILMAGSWYFDPENASEGGLAYSTQPKPGTPIDPMLPGYIKTGFGAFGKDYKDGAGGPAGNHVLGWCNVAQTGLTFDGGPITVSSDPSSGTPFTRPSGTSGTYNLTGEGGQPTKNEQVESPLHTLSYDTTNLKTAWFKVYTFSANTRVRAVFATDQCTPTAASGPASGPYNAQTVTVDYDLYLCPATGSGSCVGESRSVYDNNEGFDVTVSTAGSYRLSVVFDADASLGCNGSFSQSVWCSRAFG